MPAIDTLWIFLGLSVLFGALTVLDYVRNDSQLTITGKNWRKMAVIFAVVSLFLLATR